jgi:hypothetical protein
MDIDLAKVNPKSVRLNISLPAKLMGKIDRHAAEHHMTRSGFLAKAAQEAISGDRPHPGQSNAPRINRQQTGLCPDQTSREFPRLCQGILTYWWKRGGSWPAQVGRWKGA